MNSDSAHCDADSNSESLSLEESRELLDELRIATQGPDQGELNQFVCLVGQVVDYHDSDDCETDDHETAAFVSASLDEIRMVAAGGETFSSRMSSLRDQAIERWGDLLAPLRDPELDDMTALADDGWDAPDEPEADLSGGDPVAPSAEEIQSLLHSLGQSSDSDERALPASTEIETPVTATPTAAPPSIASLDPELREAFLDDARGCVSSMEEALLRLDADAGNSECLNQICRELHTLKGASASVGLSSLADQLHALEESLRVDPTQGRSPSVDDLLKSVDSIRMQITNHGGAPRRDTGGAGTVPEPAEMEAAAGQLDSFPEDLADDESVRVKSSQLNRLMDMLAELVMLRNRRETELTELQDVYHELIGSVSKMRLLGDDDRGQEIASSSLQLSEIANDVLEVAQSVRDCARPVAEGNAAVSQFIRQFRQELVTLRRTPISGLFRRLQRAVRDAAQAESKEVRLQLVGEDAGIERTLQQRLYEPLLHIVRNSVCHGIESAEDRSRSGKNPTGTITLEAKSSSDLFVIEIRDDGRGLDYDAIRRRGIESGLITADQAVSHGELSQLIFQAGFSTRQTANQVAGRGVGMDVVASTLRRMRGWLEVESEPQQGTRIRLSFPLPSVIQHAMVFRSGDQLFALPMQSVKSAGEFESDSLSLGFSQLLAPQAANMSDSAEGCQRIVLACRTSASADPTRSAHVTLLVDEIVGPEEVVVRPLPPMIRQHPFCSGATLSGMGQTVLVLDARRIVDSQTRLLRPSGELADASSQAGGSDDAADRSARPRVLVVDDSLSARKRVVRSLQRYRVDVVEACDGKQALAMLKTERFAAVFSDLEMPHVNGMELLAEINSNGRDHTPPVVIISSRGEDEFTQRAKELGVSSYLIKPLSDSALDKALSDIPELRHGLRHPAIHSVSTVATSGENS